MALVSPNLLRSRSPSLLLQSSNSWKSTTVQQHSLLFRSSNFCTGSTRLTLECNNLERKFRNVARKSSSLVQCSNQVVATAAETASSVGALEARFGCACVKFREAAGYTIVAMKLKDGSSARVLLQTAVISSYKSKMWHGGLEELLYTQVVEADGVGDDDDVEEAKRRPTTVGGIALRVFESEDESRMVMSECWEVEDVKSDPAQYVQVGLLISSSGMMMLHDEVAYLVLRVMQLRRGGSTAPCLWEFLCVWFLGLLRSLPEIELELELKLAKYGWPRYKHILD